MSCDMCGYKGHYGHPVGSCETTKTIIKVVNLSIKDQIRTLNKDIKIAKKELAIAENKCLKLENKLERILKKLD